METAKKVFRNLASDQTFINDILLLNKLSDKLNQILDTYLDSKYRDYYHDLAEKFTDLIGLSKKDSHIIWHLLDFFSYRVIPENELQDIEVALNEITDDKSKLSGFLEKLKDEKTQNKLNELDLIDDEIGNVNPHYKTIEYSLQDRKVIKDNKLLSNFPVVTMRIITSKEELDENVIELLEDDVDKLITKLNNIKKEIEIIKR